MIKTKNAYIALITAIVVGAVVLIMVIATSMVGIGQARNGFLAQNLAEARSLASACGEKALMELKENHDYAGNETVSLGNGQCQINPIENLGGEARVIKVSGAVNDLTKRVKIEINQIDPQLMVISWQEVSNF